MSANERSNAGVLNAAWLLKIDDPMQRNATSRIN